MHSFKSCSRCNFSMHLELVLLGLRSFYPGMNWVNNMVADGLAVCAVRSAMSLILTLQNLRVLICLRQRNIPNTCAVSWLIQYIPRNMHTVFALLCFVVVIHWLIFPYPSGLLHWHCGNLTIAPVPAKQPWLIWINTSFEFIMNDYITTTKQSTTKPCAFFLGYTVYIRKWTDNNRGQLMGFSSTHYYRQVSNIRRTKSLHSKDSRTVLQLSLPNPLKPDVKSKMKM